MKSIISAAWGEGLKIWHSKIFWVSILFFMFIPFMVGVLLFVVKHPELSGKLGMVGSKTAMLRFGNADWPTYFSLLNQVIAGVGLFGFGFLTSWVFGREYSDRTLKDLLSLPVSRSVIVLSKFIVAATWFILLSLIIFACGVLMGGMIQLSGWSNEVVFHNAGIFAGTSLLCILLCTPVAFFAGYGRGYLPPLGFVMLTLIIAQFVGLVNLAPYFPWAVPLLFTGPAGAESAQLGISSYLILLFTSILGLIGTLAWWRFADQY